jgi:hypothetical protein
MAEFLFWRGRNLVSRHGLPARRARPGRGAGPHWRTVRRSRNTCGCRGSSRRPVLRTRRAATTDPLPGPVRRGASHPKRCERGLDDGATSVACWHRANPAHEPKVAHLCRAAVAGWRTSQRYQASRLRRSGPFRGGTGARRAAHGPHCVLSGTGSRHSNMAMNNFCNARQRANDVSRKYIHLCYRGVIWFRHAFGGKGRP